MEIDREREKERERKRERKKRGSKKGGGGQDSRVRQTEMCGGQSLLK